MTTKQQKQQKRNRRFYENNKAAILAKNAQRRILHKEETKRHQKRYKKLHAEENKRYQVMYREKNKERYRQYHKTYSAEWLKNNRSKINARKRAYCANRRRTNIEFRITLALRGRLWYALKHQGTKKRFNSSSLLGCSASELKVYLELRFY